MSTEAVEPYRTVEFGNRRAALYMVPFDRDGTCEGPRTYERVVQEACAPGLTDIFVFSHGWNNDWKAATGRYDSFVDGFSEMHRHADRVPLADGYQPLLVGIFWPSAILVAPGEKAPAIAGGSGDAALDEVMAALPEESAGRVRELAGKTALDMAEALELAELVAPLYAGADDEDVARPADAPAPEELVAAWVPAAAAKPAREPGTWGTVDDAEAADPTAAGFSLDPRKALRMVTVRPMKDRAGTVGYHGVGPLLRELLDAGDKKARVHMIGHSYGCKVCLSAICAETLPRDVDSALLLQPAVNHRCFAIDADGSGRQGGYRPALDRVRQSIFTTYSANDSALKTWFHKSLTRDADVGEARIAAWPEPPSRFAALGGYGPRGAEGQTKKVDLLDPGTRYPRGGRIVAIDGTRGIAGHGDISNQYTWWALYDQVAA
jgi:hypothetical protein